MSSKVTSGLFALAILLGLASSPTVAMDGYADDPLPLFATCAGRMYAATEHHWVMSSQDASETEALYHHFVDLIDAVKSPDSGSDILTYQIEARAAFRKLLSTAEFSAKDSHKKWLDQRITQMISDCQSLLLS